MDSKIPIAACLLVARLAFGQNPNQPTATYTVLHQFSQTTSDGCSPYGGFIRGYDGNFYGTTLGCNNSNQGTVFEISPSGDYQKIHDFTGDADGSRPAGALAMDAAGNIYGSTWGNTTFRLGRDGTFTSFGFLPGLRPIDSTAQANGLVYGSDGNIYGTTIGGIRGGSGMLYSVTPNGVMTMVHAFDPQTEGTPSLFVPGTDGLLYGFLFGGRNGIMFTSITLDGVVTLIASLQPVGGLSFQLPARGPTLGSDGNFYMPSSDIVLQITPSGTITKPASLLGIINSTSPLIQGSDGNLYCSSGFAVYQITTSLTANIVYQFKPDEAHEPSALLEGPGGLYGTQSYDGGTVFQLACPGCGGGNSQGGGGSPPPATSGPITAIDPNSNPNLRALFLGADPWTSDNYQAVVNYKPAVTGLAADGVTPVMLTWRMPQMGKVTFTVTDENNFPATSDQVGSLGCVTNITCSGQGTIYMADVQMLSGVPYAFATLTSPVDFARDDYDTIFARRPINIIANLTADDGSTASQNTVLFLTHPPVVLLHGVWSSAATWTWDIVKKDPRFLTWPQDYKETNAAPFAVNLGLVPGIGGNQPQMAVQNGLNLLHSRGIAATQVDFIGHSMGGLLGRLYAGEYSGIAYYRGDNLGAGDIHKLITVDTPHNGSELASALLQPDGMTATDFGKAASLLPGIGCVTCGAAADLRPGSEPLANMPSPNVPSHAIVGTGGAAAIQDAGVAGVALSTVSQPAGFLVTALSAGSQWGLDLLFGDSQHDLIVTTTSQIGGMPADAVSFFQSDPSPLNPLWWAVHLTVTGDSRINDRVVELLNTPAGSSSFAQFPATGP